MDLTWQMIGIVVLGVFLASFIDSMAGGGGIISVPIYFLAGLPAHLALGTNKLSAGIGTMVSTSRFIKSGFIDWKLGVPSVFLALIGAHFGTRMQLAVDEKYLKAMLLVVLPFVALSPKKEERLKKRSSSVSYFQHLC